MSNFSMKQMPKVEKSTCSREFYGWSTTAAEVALEFILHHKG